VALPDASVAAYLTAVGLLSLILCYLAPLIGPALGLVDDPRAKSHSLHARPTPLVGGLAVLLPSLLLAGGDAIFAGLSGGGNSASPSNAWISLLVVTIMVIGALDDRVHLSAGVRLAIMAPLFTLFTYLNPAFGVGHLTSPAFGVSVAMGYLAAPFSALCLLAFTNAVNMADGRNGLVIGLSLIWCLTLSLYVPTHLQLLLFGVAVSLLVTGYYNLRGRLFLGDSGTYGLAALIGLTGLYAHGVTPRAGGISSTQLAALFAIPGLDMFRLILERAARGVSPMSSDHEHLHHRLERLMGWRKGLPVYLALAGVPILIACSAPDMGALGLIAAVWMYGAAWLVTRGHRQQSGA
jgi:UDP-GlcNAc:undecaprenyl-phosphate GlcNAc-1-phosphate transferase